MLFEMKNDTLETQIVDTKHFWYPLTSQDLHTAFVFSMMTILDEIHQSSKYEHIELVEFYEWIARVAFKYYDIKKA